MVSDQVKVQNMRVLRCQLVLDVIDESPELGCKATRPSKDLEKKRAPEVAVYAQTLTLQARCDSCL